MPFTHIHLLFYSVFNNQRCHPEVISLLTTTILTESVTEYPGSLGCYETNFTDNFVCDA